MHHHAGMSIQGEGWYADPHDARRLRWWDGTAWTTHTHDPAAAAPSAPVPSGRLRPALGEGWARLAVAVQVALVVTMVVAVYVIVSDRVIIDVWRRLAADPTSVPLSEADRSDSLALWSLVELPVLLVCGILFIVWLHQAHRSDRMDPTWQKRRSGWAIGGWFVPVVNLWFPFQVVSDLRRAARGDGGEPSYALQWCWWIAFLLSTLTSRISATAYNSAERVPDSDIPLYVDRLETAIVAETASEVLGLVAAVLAIAMVRQFTRWVRTSPPLVG